MTNGRRSAEPRVLALVLAGGEGRRLSPLTADRAKPAVPFGGSYRLIDFVLSNFANAGYLKIVVLTQYKSHSLDRHLAQGWRLSSMLGNYVTPVPAQMRRGPQWFSGSADAIYQNLNLISDEKPDLVCVFGADHIYHMDPRQMVEAHLETGAGVTVAAIPVPLHEGPEFGIIEAADDGRILHFHEKPAAPPPMPGDDTRALASMGNYVFTTDVLVDVVTPTDSSVTTDIGGDVIPALTEAGVAHLYDFSTNVIPGQLEHERGYWRDVGTIDAYYETNMDLLLPMPAFNLYNDQWPVYSLQLPLPPAKLGYGADGSPARVGNSMLCAGSIVSGGTVDRSILGPEVFVEGGAEITDSILFPGVRVGAGARLHRCVIDKNVDVPPGYRIGVDDGEDRDRFAVSDTGVVVVAKEQQLGSTTEPAASMTYAYLAAFAGAICYGVGSVLQSASARRVRGADHLDPKGLLNVTTRVPYLAGLGLDLVGWVLVLVALQQLPLFAVQAISASSIGITVLLASVVLKTKPNRPQLASIALMAAGLVALALAAAPDDPEPVERGFVVAVWIAIAFVAAAGAVAPHLAKGDKAASVLGIVSGLGYGGTAVCARALEADGGISDVLRDPLTWAIIPYGILGIALYAAALERGSVAVATASQYASETLVPSIIGLVFLGDHAREGLGWLAAAGFVITLAAAVALTFVSPPEQAGG